MYNHIRRCWKGRAEGEKKLINAALMPPTASESLPLDNKRRKINSSAESDPDKEWVRCGGLILTQHDLLTGQELSDKHIDFAHTLL